MPMAKLSFKWLRRIDRMTVSKSADISNATINVASPRSAAQYAVSLVAISVEWWR